jgi:hypothetical protein
MDQCLKAFETRFPTHDLSRDESGHYLDREVGQMWVAWQGGWLAALNFAIALEPGRMRP